MISRARRKGIRIAPQQLVKHATIAEYQVRVDNTAPAPRVDIAQA